MTAEGAVVVSNSCLSSQSALVFWLNEGVDGVQLLGVERVAGVVPSLWTDIRAIVQNGTDEHQSKRSETKVSKCSWDGS